jgi:hypothetical protein
MKLIPLCSTHRFCFCYMEPILLPPILLVRENDSGDFIICDDGLYRGLPSLFQKLGLAVYRSAGSMMFCGPIACIDALIPTLAQLNATHPDTTRKNAMQTSPLPAQPNGVPFCG